MTFRDDMAADLGPVFFDEESGFAEPATYVPKSGSPYAVSIIFDKAYQEVDPDSQAIIMSDSPRAKIREAQIVGTPGPGNKLTVRGVTYNIVEHMPDGQGVVELRLHV